MQTAAEISTRPDARRFSIPRFLHAVFFEGGRFWERGRLAYNGIQLLLTVIMLVIRRSKAHYFADNFGSFIAFAVMSNILYTTAYLPEALLQIPLLRRFTVSVRWCILTAGTVLACLLTIGALEVAILTDPADD